MKNIVFWIGVKSPDPRDIERHGNFQYFDISEKCWKWWCNKNDVLFIPYTYDDVSIKDTGKHKVTYQRWFDIEKTIRKHYSGEIGKIALVDGSSMIRWDTPNFFDMCSNGLTVFKSHENLRWVTEGVDGYKNLFGGFEFDLQRYFTCGFQIFDTNHFDFLNKLKEYYFRNEGLILELQNKFVKRGTDQPVYNYLAQIEKIQVNLNTLPESFFITHLQRFDWLGYNWQLNTKDPHLIKHTFIWFFSGFTDRGQRYEMMSLLWDYIKHNYE